MILDVHERHQQELVNLTLTTQPFRTFKYFILAVVQYLKQSTLYLLAKGGWLLLLSTVVVAVGILLVTVDGSHEKVLCFVCYILQRDIFVSIIADMLFLWFAIGSIVP